MKYIDFVCSAMFSPWVTKILMDFFILTQHHEGYDIIKNVNQDCPHRVYFNPHRYCPMQLATIAFGSIVVCVCGGGGEVVFIVT